MTTDLHTTMLQMGAHARKAAAVLARANASTRQGTLKELAAAIRRESSTIIQANASDVVAAKANGLSPAMIDRLFLDQARIDAIADSVMSIAAQPDPLGEVLEEWERPNGLRFRKVSVPIGVIGMIYESRPNVTVDAAALCIKSGNAVILRGGSEAVQSNLALYGVISETLAQSPLDVAAVQLVGTQDRAAVGSMLSGLDGTVDLIIPRGGKGLVARVQSDARVPVLAHLDGLNHTYIHGTADADMAERVAINAKMRRTGVCGATETLLVDAGIAKSVLPRIAAKLASLGCEMRGDHRSQQIISDMKAATEVDFETEHLAPILNIAVVDDLEQALDHIDKHGSGHTEAIISEDPDAAERFLAEVDSAVVLHNASTQFADGGEFGFGAEIGIATGRLHARGPVGARQLTSYKYCVIGNGTVRP